MRCEKCGQEFDPLQVWYRLCPKCYRLYGRRRSHPQMVWLEHSELMLLAVVAGVVLLAVVRVLAGL